METQTTSDMNFSFVKSQELKNESPPSYQESRQKKDKFSLGDIFKNITCTKISTVEFLQLHNIIPTRKECPGPLIHNKCYGQCGNQMIIKEVKDRKDCLTWRCRKTHKVVTSNHIYYKKDVKVSIRDNTWLQHTNLTLEEIIVLLYCWSHNFSNEQIAHEVGCSANTVSSWTSFLRDTCISVMLDQSDAIGGPGIHVEIDESKFGRQKYNKGHLVKVQWVLEVEKLITNRKFLWYQCMTDQTLEGLITKYIRKGSIIHSDCWKAYDKLGELGYEHITVNHSQHFKDPISGACTNRIESDWRHAKVSLPSYGVKQGKHASYLAEFMWHWVNTDKDLFIEILHSLNENFKYRYFDSLP